MGLLLPVHLLCKKTLGNSVNLALYTSSPYAVGVANATDGLEIAWMSIGLDPGDEVICCSHTMLATVFIRMAGGTPIPVDLGPDGLIDPDAISDAITPELLGLCLLS